MTTANGILAVVPGEFVAQACQGLPPADDAEDREYEVNIDAGHLGRVRIRFQRQKARHRRHSHWFWSAKHAERISTE